MTLHTHVTKDGKETLIAQMDDEHLKNTITLLVTKATTKIGLFDNKAFCDAAEIYGHQITKVNANQVRKATLETLLPYVFEAALRNLNVSADLQQLLNRTTLLPDFNLLLQAGDVEVFEEEDELL